jgi:hypothetical protein
MLATADLGAASTANLEDELTTLAAHVNAATHRLLCLIAELDRRQAWASAGALSCAHYLSWRIGLAPGPAREYVRVAHALEGLPAISAALARGEISYSKVRAVTRIARPETEADLLAMAREGTAAPIERLVRAYRRADVAAENAQAQAHQRERWLQTYWANDGSLVIEGRLTPEQGALLRKALEVVVQEQYSAGPAPGMTHPQRQADALAALADRALGSGETRAGGDRVQVVVHVDAEVLADPAADGRSEIEDGPGVPAETSRRLACDCSLVELRHGPDGELWPGRKTRVISTPLRRAIAARDGGHCAFPGCTNRHCDGHHLQHWADGGETNLNHIVQLCPHHHTLVHEGGWRAERRADGTLHFYRPDGSELPAVPAPPPIGPDPAAALRAAQARLGITAATGMATWDGRPIDYDWGLSELVRRGSRG